MEIIGGRTMKEDQKKYYTKFVFCNPEGKQVKGEVPDGKAIEIAEGKEGEVIISIRDIVLNE